MDSSEINLKIPQFVKNNYLPFALAVAGMIFFVYGLISLMGSASNSSGLSLKQTENNVANGSNSTIVVDIEGAVVRPGVYSLSANARIQDALVAASGLSSDANREWVSKNLNLATKLTDGVKLYIPRLGEKAVAVSESNAQAGGLINLNTASTTDLDSLPGVGPATAQKIMENRPYSSLGELVSKKVVSQKVFDGFKDKIAL